MIEPTGFEWRTSSYSANGGQCVAVARLADGVAARDTKQTGTGPLLVVPVGAWGAFVAAVKDGP